MTDNKNYKVEWTFDFEKVADRIKGSVEGLVGDVEVKSAHYDVPLEGATAAQIELGLSVGNTNVHALGESANLFEADVTYVGEMEFSNTGEGIKQIKLAQKTDLSNLGESIKRSIGIAVKGNNLDLKWDVGLTKNLPIDLKLNGGIGPAVIDLSEIDLRGLTVDGGVGETTITLPSTNDVYSVNVDGGVGRTHLTVAKDAMVNLKIDGGVGGVYVTIQEGAHVNLKIDGGVGETKVEVPAEAGVSVASSGGLGNVVVPAHFSRLTSEDNFIGHGGTWETANYAASENKITIEHEGGVGQLIIR